MMIALTFGVERKFDAASGRVPRSQRRCQSRGSAALRSMASRTPATCARSSARPTSEKPVCVKSHNCGFTRSFEKSPAPPHGADPLAPIPAHSTSGVARKTVALPPRRYYLRHARDFGASGEPVEVDGHVTGSTVLSVPRGCAGPVGRAGRSIAAEAFPVRIDGAVQLVGFRGAGSTNSTQFRSNSPKGGVIITVDEKIPHTIWRLAAATKKNFGTTRAKLAAYTERHGSNSRPAPPAAEARPYHPSALGLYQFRQTDPRSAGRGTTRFTHIRQDFLPRVRVAGQEPLHPARSRMRFFLAALPGFRFHYPSIPRRQVFPGALSGAVRFAVLPSIPQPPVPCQTGLQRGTWAPSQKLRGANRNIRKAGAGWSGPRGIPA